MWNTYFICKWRIPRRFGFGQADARFWLYGCGRYVFWLMTIECSRNSPPIFTNFYEQAANFDEIIYHPEKYGTIDIRYILWRTVRVGRQIIRAGSWLVTTVRSRRASYRLEGWVSKHREFVLHSIVWKREIYQRGNNRGKLQWKRKYWVTHYCRSFEPGNGLFLAF